MIDDDPDETRRRAAMALIVPRPPPFAELTFHVPGGAETKGSWKPLVNPRTGRVHMKADNEREGPWAESVAWAARAASRGHVADDRRYEVHVWFVLPAKSRARRHLRDIDKLARSVLDALTGIIWKDDERVDRLVLDKDPIELVNRWPGGEHIKPGATFTIRPITKGRPP